jgi:serine/threonine protein kinase
MKLKFCGQSLNFLLVMLCHHWLFFYFSLAKDPVVSSTLQVYGVSAVPNEPDSDVGHLVIITEVGQMNALQLYQAESVPLHVTLDLWARIATGLCCIHNKHVLHQDLKPENILITSVRIHDPGLHDFLIFHSLD